MTNRFHGRIRANVTLHRLLSWRLDAESRERVSAVQYPRTEGKTDAIS
jgi:hypothetical protein